MPLDGWTVGEATSERLRACSPDAFADVFPIDAATAASILGAERVELATDDQADARRQEGAHGDEEES